MHPSADANEAFLITVSIVLMKRVIALCPAIECRRFPKGEGKFQRAGVRIEIGSECLSFQL